MSLSILFTGASDGDDGPFFLASASEWALFGEWAEGLPSEYAAVKALADGEVKGTDELSRQLTAALAAHPPREPLPQGLLDLGVGDPDETATVTD